MRVRLKGLNARTKRLADGRVVTYWYAWKGGPRLPGKPGDPEFMAAYNAAVSARKAPPEGTMFSILAGYQQTAHFKSTLSERSRKDYIKHIKAIEAEFGDFPLSAMADRRTRGEFLAWRDRLADRSRRQADYSWSVLAAIVAWAFDRGLVTTNPCLRAGRLYQGTRADSIWSDADEGAFLTKAPKHLHLPLLLALWTGQRQGDLLRLPWSAYDGTHITLKQGKTGARPKIKVGAPLKAALDAAARRSPVILTNLEGQPWTADGFRSSWRKACAKAGVVGVTFHDLRGTAVTRLAKVGCTVPQIASVTGHSLKDVHAILDAHYLGRDQAMADEAVEKLERRTKIPD